MEHQGPDLSISAALRSWPRRRTSSSARETARLLRAFGLPLRRPMLFAALIQLVAREAARLCMSVRRLLVAARVATWPGSSRGAWAAARLATAKLTLPSPCVWPIAVLPLHW